MTHPTRINLGTIVTRSRTEYVPAAHSMLQDICGALAAGGFVLAFTVWASALTN